MLQEIGCGFFDRIYVARYRLQWRDRVVTVIYLKVDIVGTVYHLAIYM